MPYRKCRSCRGEGEIFIALKDVRPGQWAILDVNVKRQECAKCSGTGRVYYKAPKAAKP